MTELHAELPLESHARMMRVFVPCKRGIPEAIHVPVPDAVPPAPAAVCHVTLAIPLLAEAFPDTVAEEAFTVTTETEGEVTKMETEELADGEAGGEKAIVAVWVTLRPPESKVVTLMLFAPETSGITPVPHDADAVPVNFATAVPL